MTTHTPGPWEARGLTIWEPGKSALSIAVVTQHEPNARANARLISAAPDMLDALEQCAEYFDKFADADHDQDGFVPNEAMQMLTLVMNAIAKVEGRT
jgi:hypothetical protein